MRTRTRSPGPTSITLRASAELASEAKGNDAIASAGRRPRYESPITTRKPRTIAARGDSSTGHQLDHQARPLDSRARLSGLAPLNPLVPR